MTRSLGPAQHSLKKAVPSPPHDLLPTTPGPLICMATRGATRVDDDDDDNDDDDDDDNAVVVDDDDVVDVDDDSAFVFSA